jgi:hypothetical protein
MPEWIWIIIIGVVVLGLISFIARDILKRISGLFAWKAGLDKRGGAMTHNEHRAFCNDITQSFGQEVKTQMEDFKQTILDQFTGFKTWMNLYVENTILKEMRENGNNKKVVSKRKR